MAYYKRTRVVSQDMRTGEFAYLDQLIKDGYNPGLLVLPKNWEPALRQGPSSFLPIVPIINLSPPNTTDTFPFVLQNLINLDTGAAVLELFSNGYVGNTSYTVAHNVTGVQCDGLTGTVPDNVGEPVTGVSNTGSVGTTIDAISFSNITGVSSTGSTGATSYTTGVNVTGISSTGSVGTTTDTISQTLTVSVESIVSLGTVLNGSGWSEGGGWGDNTWGQA